MMTSHLFLTELEPFAREPSLEKQRELVGTAVRRWLDWLALDGDKIGGALVSTGLCNSAVRLRFEFRPPSYGRPLEFSRPVSGRSHREALSLAAETLKQALELERQGLRGRELIEALQQAFST